VFLGIQSRPSESLPRLSLAVNSRAGQAPNHATTATATAPSAQAVLLSFRLAARTA